MLDRSVFKDVLKDLKEFALVSSKELTFEDVKDYMDEYQLDDEQLHMVYDYICAEVKSAKEEKPSDGESTADDAAMSKKIDALNEFMKSDDDDEDGDSEQAVNSASEDASTESETTSEAEARLKRLKEGTKAQKEAEDKFLNSKLVKMYLNEVKGIKPLSDEELLNIYEKSINGDSSVNKMIIEQHLSDVIEIAKKYVRLSVKMEDVVQEGNMGLIEAVADIKVSEASKVREYLMDSIKTAMETYIDSQFHSDEWLQAVVDRAELLNQAREYLAKENMHVPSDEELSEYTKVPVDEISDLMAIVKKKEGSE